MNINCWEYFGCGREPGGARASELDVCPATIALTLDGAHGGKNGGRACWVVAGTFCDSLLQGTYARKIDSCKECDFYNLVKSEDQNLLQFALSEITLP
jgi:hypothetical protein